MFGMNSKDSQRERRTTREELLHLCYANNITKKIMFRLDPYITRKSDIVSRLAKPHKI